MTPSFSTALAPLLRRLEAERAHRLAVLALRLGLAGREARADDPVLGVQALGQWFANPVGLAAGFDKEAVAVRGLGRLGFGFVETGTVTLRPQGGNPVPRVFRLPEDGAVINRYGLNSRGLEAYVARLARLPGRSGGRRALVVGANVGINKEGADPVRDYAAMVAAVAPHVDYVVINVSSPNTPGLRDLQGERQLREILEAIAPERPPLLVKVAPELDEAGLEVVVEACAAYGVAGLIVSNTTTARDGLRSAARSEAGGLSGAPLREPSTAMVGRAYRLAAGRLEIVGCGGVATGEHALEKIRAGARLVQLYTAFAYDGPAIVGRIKRELAAALRREGFASVGDAVGTAQ